MTALGGLTTFSILRDNIVMVYKHNTMTNVKDYAKTRLGKVIHVW